MAQRLELAAVFIRQVILTSDQRRNQHRKNRTRFTALAREIGFNEGAQAADHHLVAGT